MSRNSRKCVGQTFSERGPSPPSCKGCTGPVKFMWGVATRTRTLCIVIQSLFRTHPVRVKLWLPATMRTEKEKDIEAEK